MPADHPDKHKEIGSEPTPAAFLSTLLALTREWRRILTPTGSLCVELGDTYSGSGGAGGDYGPVGLRNGQPEFDGSAARTRSNRPGQYGTDTGPQRRTITDAWPLDKSLCLIPSLYAGSLAYGRNLLRAPLTGQELLDFIDSAVEEGFTAANAITAARIWLAAREDGDPDRLDPWRVRNLIVWHRPNPPVGALGDKVRPSTSYVTVACTAKDRWFDLDAERNAHAVESITRSESAAPRRMTSRSIACPDNGEAPDGAPPTLNPAGAPPLDCWIDTTTEDVWTIPTAPYAGAHYATFPPALPRKLINLMRPRQVCTICGEPRRRIVGEPEYVQNRNGTTRDDLGGKAWNGHVDDARFGRAQTATGRDSSVTRQTETLGWSDCGHNTWRRGIVCDPFAGSGTTLQAASELGRDSIGIDLDPRNLELARQRLGMFLVEEDEVVA